MRKQYKIIVAVVVVLVSGCGQEMRNRNLEKVAKDWCMVIRASQVVPVYPLTEDLQVGDMFLVQHTVDVQHKQYEKRGFLPMDNLVARLDPNGFGSFYDHSFASNEPDITLPLKWLEPGNQVGWDKAPSASFPTYSFSVRRGAGFSLAVPVQSVPIALSLMGADAGEGTISIGEAKTYGIDTMSLYYDVLKWERKNYAFLLNYASTNNKTNYIRVVSRIYLAGKMNVSIHASRSWSGRLSVGQERPLKLLTLTPSEDPNDIRQATVETYSNALEALNETIEKASLPGGTVKIVSASGRSVSMAETFARPLAVGYLGFDMAIGPDGVLGPPIPTHAVLTYEALPSVPELDKVLLMKYARLARAYEIIDDLANAGEKEAAVLRAALDELVSILPPNYKVPIFDDRLEMQVAPEEDPRSAQPLFTDITIYLSQLGDSLKVLEKADKSSEKRKQWLEPTRKVLEDMRIALKVHRLLLRRLNKYVSSYFERR